MLQCRLLPLYRRTMAKIYQPFGRKTEPDLFLQMAAANLGKPQSVVLSVIDEDGKQETYWTSMPNKDLTFHLFHIHNDLTKEIQEQ